MSVVFFSKESTPITEPFGGCARMQKEDNCLTVICIRRGNKVCFLKKLGRDSVPTHTLFKNMIKLINLGYTLNRFYERGNFMGKKKEEPIDLNNIKPEEKLKYEIAEELEMMAIADVRMQDFLSE